MKTYQKLMTKAQKMTLPLYLLYLRGLIQTSPILLFYPLISVVKGIDEANKIFPVLLVIFVALAIIGTMVYYPTDEELKEARGT